MEADAGERLGEALLDWAWESFVLCNSDASTWLTDMDQVGCVAWGSYASKDQGFSMTALFEWIKGHYAIVMINSDFMLPLVRWHRADDPEDQLDLLNTARILGCFVHPTLQDRVERNIREKEASRV